ncbi:MAG: helix-turn-helix transcriptional regulator, partial [Candidatus Heimdallarchaeota archaeon]
PTRSSTEDGIVKIIWELDHVLLDFEYLYILRYEQSPFYSPITIYEPGLRYAYIYVILAFFSGVGLSIGVFVLIIKRKYQPAKIDLLSSLLSESEQAVITAINDEGGVAIQRRICERTSFSKSKVSQILLKLEEKNVLKRERWGRTNRVTITNPSFLKIALEDSSSKEESE